MVKTVAHTPKLKRKFYPLVSICTPTFNRRPFIPTVIQCVRNQTYPRDRLEWIIVDDGTDPIEDVLKKDGLDLIPMIRYVRPDKHMKLGEKRNYMHTFCKGSIIVYMDDDDYYPPERVEHAVDVLQENRDAMCAGASELYVYFKHIQQMYQFGPYGPNHSTAGTFAFRAELLKITRYDDNAALAEEKEFLKNYTIPFAQLDPMRTILVFSHIHNTFDKKKLLENGNPVLTKLSAKRVDDFIRQPFETGIREFFMERIDSMLEPYLQGLPSMKPDVLEQIKKIDAERMALEEKAKREGQKFMMNIPGKPPVELSMEEVVTMMNNHVSENQRLHEEINRLNQQIVQNMNPTITPPIITPNPNIPSSIIQTSNQSIESNIGFVSNLVDSVSKLESKLESADKEIAKLKTEITKLRIEKMKATMQQECAPAPPIPSIPTDNRPLNIIPLASKSKPEVYVDMNS